MKPADAKAPKFDSKWWKLNKAKGADADAGFEKALKKYEDTKKSFFEETKNPNGAKSSAELQQLLLAVKAQATKKKADPKLGIGQKETKEALGNYEKQCDTAISECKRIEASPLMKMGAADLVKSAPQFQTYCNKIGFLAESYNFISLMAKNPKKERRWYDDFIKSGSKFELNLPGSVKNEFDGIAARITAGTAPDTTETWAAAPWDQAVKEIAFMLDKDPLKRWRAWALGQMLKPKLP
ncbi:MAG TPA: hypothetical protein VGH01_07170 [Jatrophihabitantaceae bacterium]